MKPPPFTYHAPATLAETLEVLAELGEDGKVLAGGQSLIPLLNMRLAAPAHLVDVNGVSELDVVDVGPDEVRVGAIARHARIERDDGAAAACPLLRQALRLVAHAVIRNRGTTCGSLAHADPAGEMTAVLAVLGGTVRLASAAAGRVTRRDLTAGKFFVAPLESSLRPGELLESAGFPRTPASTGTAFAEVARRHGDYALCGIAALVDLDAGGEIASARVGTISVTPTPLVVDLTDVLAGVPPARADLAAAREKVMAHVDPEADLHASAAYRRHLAGVLTERAVRQAAARSAHAPAERGAA